MTRSRAGRAVQGVAIAGLLASGAIAVGSYRRTSAFLARAAHASGAVVPEGRDPARIRVRFTAASGEVVTFDAPAPPHALPPGPVPVAYAEGPGGVDARIEVPYLLWDQWHDWLGFLAMSAFLAIYGHALLTDPLSVIAFRRWR